MRINKTPIPLPDPNVVLPSDVRRTIARGEAEFRKIAQQPSVIPSPATEPLPITSIIDREEHLRRERHLDAKERGAQGRRGRPPKVHRLRIVAIFADYLEGKGTKFSTGRNSRMNKAIQQWMIEV